MRAVDEDAVSAGVGIFQMMENAGRSLAEVALIRYRPGTVVVLAGAGNNGGGGMVAARHLRSRGVEVSLVLSAEPEPGSVCAAQLQAARAAGVAVVDQPGAADLVVDALVGYGLSGPLRGTAEILAEWAVGQPSPVLALDVPSGLNADDGSVGPIVVCADATLTLALPKRGLSGSPCVGDLVLADITVPRATYERLGIDVPELFTGSAIVGLTVEGGTALRVEDPLAWRTPWGAALMILRGRTFAAAGRIALVVGTLLTGINLGGPIFDGDLAAATVPRIVSNYAIPYVVSSLGLLSRSRIRE